MLYSDMKYPYVKAKADPGLAEGLRSTARFLSDHGATRRVDVVDANKVMLMERHAQMMQQQRRAQDLLEEKQKRMRPDSFMDRDTE
jgi:hypothetical protein